MEVQEVMDPESPDFSYEIEVNLQTASSQTSLLIVAFFALSCFYFILTMVSVYRLCTLESNSAAKEEEPNILRIFLVFIVTASALRLAGWLLCCGFFFTNNKNFIKYATYEQIKRLTIEAKEQDVTYWLPLEPDSISGINQSPVLLVMAIFTPEVFVQIAFISLCWLCFSAYIDSHTHGLNLEKPRVSGQVIFRCIFAVLLLVQVVLVTLVLAETIDAMTI